MAKADNHHPFSPQVTSEAHVTCGEGTWNIFTDYKQGSAGARSVLITWTSALSSLSSARGCLPRIQPDLDQIRHRPNKKQRENRSVNDLIQPEKKLCQGYTERHQTLAREGANRRLRIGNHEKDEQLIHGSGDGRYLCLPGIASNPAAQERKQKERHNIGGANVKPAGAPNNDRAQDPDNQQRPVVIPPLDAENGHRLRR